MIGRFGGGGPAPELTFKDLFIIFIIVCVIAGIATGSVLGFIIFIIVPFAGYYVFKRLSRWRGFKYVYYIFGWIGFLYLIFKVLVN